VVADGLNAVGGVRVTEVFAGLIAGGVGPTVVCAPSQGVEAWDIRAVWAFMGGRSCSSKTVRACWRRPISVARVALEPRRASRPCLARWPGPASTRRRAVLLDLEPPDGLVISGGVGEPNRVSLELAARSSGHRPHIAYETRDYQVTLALIEAGLGISLVPASVLGHTSRPGIAFRPVEGMPLAPAIYLVHRKRTTALVTDIKTMITDLNPDTTAG
jgi:DNA-binding transcriptional LysR family regulator